MDETDTQYAVGRLEKSYQSTYREADEHILIAALGSMKHRTLVKEATLSFPATNFFNGTHERIWTAAKQLSTDDRLLLLDNFKPLLNESQFRVLKQHHGNPVREVELQGALHLVGEAARQRRLIDALRSVAVRVEMEDEYGPCLSAAHEAVAGLEGEDVSAGSVTIEDSLTEFWEEMESPPDETPRLATPWPSVNEPYLSGGVLPGQLVVTMAESGGGKSVALLQMATTWLEQGKRIAVFSLEMSAADVTDRVLSCASGVKLRSIAQRSVEDRDLPLVQDASDRLVQSGRLHIFDTTELTMSDMRQRCSVLQRTEGLDVVVIDYIQIVNPENRVGANREQQVAEIVRQMKLLSMSGVVVLTASQMNGSSDRPSKASTRESQAIVHHADLVLALHHDRDKPGDVDMVVVKNRRGPESDGSLMWWKPNISRIVDPTA